MRSLLELLAGSGLAGVAYELDADLAALVNGSATLEEVFLADPQLLTLLQPSGSDDLATAREFLADAATDLLAAIESIGGEIDDQSDDVLVIDAADSAAVTRVRSVVERLREALAGETVFEASVFPELTADQRMTLVPLFEGDIASLRPFVPSFVDGRPDPCQFPDPTFGGLAPDGTQEQLSHLLCTVPPPIAPSRATRVSDSPVFARAVPDWGLSVPRTHCPRSTKGATDEARGFWRP